MVMGIEVVMGIEGGCVCVLMKIKTKCDVLLVRFPGPLV